MAEMTSTDIFGKLHFQSAKTLLINGGRITLSTKSRLSRFKGDDVQIYNKHECECFTALKIGRTETLFSHLCH